MPRTIASLRGIYERYQSQMNAFQSLIEDGQELKFRELFDQSDADLCLLLEVLYYGGRHIYADSNLDLAKLSLEEVREEFYTFCDRFMANRGLSFGKPLEGERLHVRDYGSSPWKDFILPAIALL